MHIERAPLGMMPIAVLPDGSAYPLPMQWKATSDQPHAGLLRAMEADYPGARLEFVPFQPSEGIAYVSLRLEDDELVVGRDLVKARADQRQQRNTRLAEQFDAIASNPFRWNALTPKEQKARKILREELLDFTKRDALDRDWPDYDAILAGLVDEDVKEAEAAESRDPVSISMEGDGGEFDQLPDLEIPEDLEEEFAALVESLEDLLDRETRKKLWADLNEEYGRLRRARTATKTINPREEVVSRMLAFLGRTGASNV